MHAYIIILYVTNTNMEEDGGLQLAEGKCQMGCCINSSKMVEVHVKLLNKKKLLFAEAIIYDHTTPHHILSFAVLAHSKCISIHTLKNSFFHKLMPTLQTLIFLFVLSHSTINPMITTWWIFYHIHGYAWAGSICWTSSLQLYSYGHAKQMVRNFHCIDFFWIINSCSKLDEERFFSEITHCQFAILFLDKTFKKKKSLIVFIIMSNHCLSVCVSLIYYASFISIISDNIYYNKRLFEIGPILLYSVAVLLRIIRRTIITNGSQMRLSELKNIIYWAIIPRLVPDKDFLVTSHIKNLMIDMETYPSNFDRLRFEWVVIR